MKKDRRKVIRGALLWPVLLAIVAPLLLVACEVRNSSSPRPPPSSSTQMTFYEDLKRPRDEGEVSALGEPARKLIRTYKTTVETADVDRVFAEVLRLGQAAKGYAVSTSRERLDDGALAARVLLRLPPAGVGDFLARLRGLGKIVREESSTDDVTEDYVDLEARLKNAKASEQRLLDLMNRKTTKLADVLAVETELTRVRGDVEAAEGKKRVWDLLTQTVAVDVKVVEPAHATPAARQVWSPLKTAFADFLVAFAESLHGAVVFAGAALPWVAGLGLAAGLWVRSRRRRKTP